MTSFREMRRLSLYEECTGPLEGLTDQDGVLVALIGKIHFALLLDMEESLRALIGQRITILRTDVPDKQYIVRVLVNDQDHADRDE
jgi:hypothetical protein